MWRKIRRLAALALPLVGVAEAQPALTVRLSDADTTWAVSREGGADAAVTALHRLGHVAARVDSLRGDTLYATAGRRLAVERVEVVGAGAVRAADLTREWATRPGAAYDAEALGADLQAAAATYARLGFTDAVLVPDVEVTADGVVVTVRVDEGPGAAIVGVELVGARRPSRAFASRVAGVAAGTPAGSVDGARVRQSLEATGLYLSVSEPVIAKQTTGEYVLQVPVREAPPGTFDLALGLLPAAGGEATQLVGSGRLHLRNLFGGGRALDVALVRNPGLASDFAFAARDPFVLGLPIGAAAAFEGTSQDSTFSRQRYGLDVLYPLGRGLAVVGSVRRESVRPGTFGAREVDGRPRVRRSDALYAGAGVVLERLDAPRNPRSGAALALSVEQGRPRRDLSGADAALDGRPVYRRLSAEARGYLPTLRRQTAVVGLDARLLGGPTGPAALYDEAELFRTGGAQTLRGYDEDQFLGRAVGRLLGEYRLLLDAESYAVAFADLGFVDRPDLPGRPGERRWLPGYGAGLRVRTGLGLASVTYALNPDLSVGRGKVHVGLAVGL